jgi:hypothetical protein
MPCSSLQAVLYGIFGAVLLGGGAAVLVTRWRKRHLAKLRAAQQASDLSTNYRDIHRFTEPTQVCGLSSCSEGIACKGTCV